MSVRTNQDPKLDLGRKTVVLFGDTGTGKSLIYERFIEHRANSKEQADRLKNLSTPLTIFDNPIHGKYIDLLVWETTGKEPYRRLRSVFYTNLHVAILCYAINNRESYENIEHIYQKELHDRCPNASIILVANKIDLLQSSEEKFISHEQGLQLAKRIKASAYVETSAKENTGLKELIENSAKAAAAGPKVKVNCSIL